MGAVTFLSFLPWPRFAIERLHAAMAKVANGDVSAIKALYSHTEDATSFYGWGGYEKGWDKVSRRWDHSRSKSTALISVSISTIWPSTGRL